ncbi:glycosyltransferase [Paraliomyxa miuraensis]|uniref:glycosyltransferase n=1 Tax=Paraliomyxa miuraensis TaxID=376150 RepID=UPI0022515325|nr:glycosyltransferase [Paraliomyxa miuraensis]MCX4246552.1 glycosyltransferase [Paraliomyxa miuraensis]
MRWQMFCVGSRGDVQPFVALGRALVDQGHTVRIAAFEPHRALVQAHGLELTTLGPLPDEFAGPRRSPPFIGLGGRALFWGLVRRVLARYLPRFAEVADGADALMYSGLAFVVHHLAERLDVPTVSVALVPHVPTRAFVDPFFAGHPLARVPAFRRLTGQAERALMLGLCAGPVARWRSSLGLPPVPRGGWLAHRERMVTHELLAYSELLLPRPADWPKKVVVTGFWHQDARHRNDAHPDVEQFLGRGPAPILVGFGSMSPGTTAARFRAVLGAAADLGERVLVIAPQGPVDIEGIARRAGLGSRSFLRVDELSHAWVLPRVALAIHHGGIGTLGAVVRAGTPSVVMPHDYDQFFWGERVERLGIGVARARGRPATRAWVRRAIRDARCEPVAARVTSLARALAAEDGVATAVRVLG